MVSFTYYIKLDTFAFIFFILFGTQTGAYGSSIALHYPPHLLKLIVDGGKSVLSEFILTAFGLAWPGRLIKDTLFIGSL